MTVVSMRKTRLLRIDIGCFLIKLIKMLLSKIISKFLTIFNLMFSDNIFKFNNVYFIT